MAAPRTPLVAFRGSNPGRLVRGINLPVGLRDIEKFVKQTHVVFVVPMHTETRLEVDGDTISEPRVTWP